MWRTTSSQVDGALGHEDHVGAAGDPGVERDVPGVAPHHLADDDAAVGLGGGVEPVDGLGGDGDRGVEAEGVVGPGEVVVDGLRHPHHVHPHLVEAGGDAERVLPADGHHRADVVAGQRVHDDLRAVGTLEGVGAGGAEDGPAQLEDAGGVLAGDPEVVVLEEPLPAVAHAGELESVLLAAADHRPDDGVQAGAISSPGEDGDLHVDDLRLGCSPTSTAGEAAGKGPPRGGGLHAHQPQEELLLGVGPPAAVLPHPVEPGRALQPHAGQGDSTVGEWREDVLRGLGQVAVAERADAPLEAGARQAAVDPPPVERPVEALAGVPELVEDRGDPLLGRGGPEPEGPQRDDVEDLPPADADEGLAQPAPAAAGAGLPEVGRPDGGPRGPARLPGHDQHPGRLHVGELGQPRDHVPDQPLHGKCHLGVGGPPDIDISPGRSPTSPRVLPPWCLSRPGRWP